MIYIVCDMNCNNHGNFFKVVGCEREVKEDDTSYISGSTYYPKGHCYRAQRLRTEFVIIPYSEAIDRLIPEDYVRWQETRFGRKL